MKAGHRRSIAGSVPQAAATFRSGDLARRRLVSDVGAGVLSGAPTGFAAIERRASVRVQPVFERLEAVRPVEEVLDELGRRLRTARLEHARAVADRGVPG